MVIFERGERERGLREMEESVRLASDGWEGHFNLALALSRTGQWERAAGHYREVLRLNPGFTEARRRLEEARRRAKDGD